MAANILTKDELTALFDTGSLEGFYGGLCAGGKYICALPGAEPVTANRGFLENLAEYNYYAAYRKLYLFSEGRMRDFIRTAVEIKFIGILFKLLRIIEEGGDISLRYSVIPGWYGEGSSLNWPAIVSADTPDKLLENFKAYPEYCEVIKRYIKDGKIKNTGMMEIETVNLYYKRILGFAEKMQGEQKDRFEKLLYAEINEINRKRERRLEEFESDGRVRYLIPVPAEKAGITADPYKEAEKEIRNEPGPATVYSMLKLKERESKRVVKTVECIRYSLKRDEFERFVFEEK